MFVLFFLFVCYDQANLAESHFSCSFILFFYNFYSLYVFNMRTLYFLVLVQVQQQYDIFVFFCIHLCVILQMWCKCFKVKWNGIFTQWKERHAFLIGNWIWTVALWVLLLNDELQTPGCCKIICQTSVFVHTSNSSAVLKHVEVALNMRHRNCCQYSSSSATEYFNLFATCCTHIYNLVKTSYSKDYKSIIRTCDIWLLPLPVFALCSVWWAKKNPVCVDSELTERINRWKSVRVVNVWVTVMRFHYIIELHIIIAVLQSILYALLYLKKH